MSADMTLGVGDDVGPPNALVLRQVETAATRAGAAARASCRQAKVRSLALSGERQCLWRLA
jgi:hypothetical protein